MTYRLHFFIATGLVACMATTFSPAQAPAASFELKGYAVGSLMESCPLDTLTILPQPDGITVCTLPITSVAGEEVQFFTLMLWSGRLMSIGVTGFPTTERSSSSVLQALIERFGLPQSESRVLRDYLWNGRSSRMSFSGRKGTLVIVDTPTYSAMRKGRSERRSGDL